MGIFYSLVEELLLYDVGLMYRLATMHRVTDKQAYGRTDRQTIL